MTQSVSVGGLQVNAALKALVDTEISPGTGVSPETVWAAFDAIVHEFGPRNRALLAHRDALQAKIDDWHKARKGQPHDAAAYKAFLGEIGYLQPEPADFEIDTANVDTEIREQAGPQLVVPVKNARYALNAANARWGSLYDALYGSDVISEDGGAERAGAYNPVRGGKVIAFARQHLDTAAPLATGTHVDATAYAIVDGALQVTLKDGATVGLAQPEKCVGYLGDAAFPSAVLLKNNGLHIEIQIDPKSPIGATDAAGVKDLLVEAAITTIMDCEDSVAAVDAEDKIEVYRNWAGPDERHARRTDGQGRQDHHPAPQRRPFLHGAGRRGAALARPQPPVRAQRRSPDDQPGHSRQGRP